MLVRGLTVLVYDWSDDWSTNELILKVTQQNRRLQFEYYNRLPNRTKDRSQVTYYYKIKKNKISESFPHFPTFTNPLLIYPLVIAHFPTVANTLSGTRNRIFILYTIIDMIVLILIYEFGRFCIKWMIC